MAMKAVHKFLIGGAAMAVAAGGFAAPAAAQYYPGGGYGGGNVLVGAILDSILRGGAGGYGGYGGYGGGYGQYGYANERVAVDQCARAAEARLNGRYGGGYGGYGYNAGIRVNQIERVERTRNGNFRVVGWAGDGGWRGNYGGYGGYNAPYGGGYYGNAAAPSYRFSCKFDLRSGRISDLDLNRQRYARYGYGY
jgi:hypothetical protein